AFSLVVSSISIGTSFVCKPDVFSSNWNSVSAEKAKLVQQATIKRIKEILLTVLCMVCPPPWHITKLTSKRPETAVIVFNSIIHPLARYESLLEGYFFWYDKGCYYGN